MTHPSTSIKRLVAAAKNNTCSNDFAAEASSAGLMDEAAEMHGRRTFQILHDRLEVCSVDLKHRGLGDRPGSRDRFGALSI